MTFKVSKQDKSSSRLAIDDLSHKKVILYILLLTLFILPSYSFTDLTIYFNETGTFVNKSYTFLNTYNNKNINTLNNNNSEYVEDFNNNNILSYYLFAVNNTVSGILDSGNIELIPNSMLSFAKNSYTAGGIVSSAILLKFNHTYLINSNSKLQVKFRNYSLSGRTEIFNYVDNIRQNKTYMGLFAQATDGSSCNLCQKNRSLTNFDDTTFNRIMIANQPSGAASIITTNILWIKLINLTDITNNQLPSFNVSFNSTCSANGQTNITPIIYSNDPEGDILYYATDFSQVANVSEEVIYDTGGVLLNSPLYNFLLNTYNDGSYCYFNRESLSTPVNYSKFNLAEYALNPSLFNSFGNKYMARLNSNCNGKPEFIYRFDRPFGYMEYFTTIYDLIDTGEYFNVTMYDINLDPIVKFRYEVLNNKVLIKYYNHTSTDKHGHNITQLLELGNYTITNQTQKIEFLYYNVPNESFSRLYDYHKNTIYQINNLLEDKTINYVGISIGNYEIFQDGFRYAGSVPSLEFSTTPFGNFNIRDTERYVLNYYMSDSIHQPDEYTYQRYIVNVPECGVVNGGWEDLENYDDLASAGDILRLLYNFIGKPIRNYNSALDPDGLGETVFIWWVYLGLFIMFSVTMFNFTRTFSIIAPLILSSLLIAGYSLLSGYIVSLIVSLMLLAFSVAGPIVGGMNNGGK